MPRYQTLWCSVFDNVVLCLAEGAGALIALFCNGCDRRFPEAVFFHPFFASQQAVRAGGGSSEGVRLAFFFCKGHDGADSAGEARTILSCSHDSPTIVDNAIFKACRSSSESCPNLLITSFFSIVVMMGLTAEDLLSPAFCHAWIMISPTVAEALI